MSGPWDAGRIWRERERSDVRPYVTAHTDDGALVAEADLPGSEYSTQANAVLHITRALIEVGAAPGAYVMILRDHAGEPLLADQLDHLPSGPVVEHVSTTALETRPDGVHAVTTDATIIGPRSITRPEVREP